MGFEFFWPAGQVRGDAPGIAVVSAEIGDEKKAAATTRQR
jgi:hypothetical protein